MDASVCPNSITKPSTILDSRNESLRKLREKFKNELDKSIEKIKNQRNTKRMKNYFKVKKGSQTGTGRYDFLNSQASRVNKMLKSKYSQDLNLSATKREEVKNPKNETINLQQSLNVFTSSDDEDPEEMTFRLPPEHLKHIG